MRKTKIVCTLGPALDNDLTLKRVIENGLDVARFNFSHGDHEEQFGRVERIRRICKELNTEVALLLDTKGPEIRTGKFANGPVLLTEGSELVIRHEEILGDATQFSVSYKNLHQDVQVGTKILIDDGLVEIEVLRIENKDIYCRVNNQGNVSNYKSINVPNTSINLPALTERDINDLGFAVKHGFDFIAASFIRKASDVLQIRAELDRMGGSEIKIISKIENREGVDNFADILKVSDGIMVARGDLGVEIPAYEVPQVQKYMIRECYRYGKPVITATQMLDSMMRNPRPTRAEVSDVANAVLDGTSAVMLSGESANGKYPVEAVSMMREIVINTEASTDYWERFRQSDVKISPTVGNAISRSCCTAAMDLQAKAIIAVSISGRTARMISRFRPACPVIATATCPRVIRQLRLSWGVMPYLVDAVKTTDEVFELGKEIAVQSGLVKKGDVVIITCGTPVGTSGTTNTLKIQNIGDVIVQGECVEGSKAEGVAAEVVNLSEIQTDTVVTRGEKFILVADQWKTEYSYLLDNAAAVILQSPSVNPELLSYVKENNIPLVFNCNNAVSILKSGLQIFVDPKTGIVG